MRGKGILFEDGLMFEIFWAAENGWMARIRLSDGSWTTRSKFSTKSAAFAWVEQTYAQWQVAA